MKSRTTIKDIAMDVGVSHTTVSYILSGTANQKISEKTRNAVLEAAERLHYVPNSAARSLRSNSSGCVGVALEKSITSTRFADLLQGVREGLQTAGYWPILFDFSESGAYPDYINSIFQRRTDGVIYISSNGYAPADNVLQAVEENAFPFVACDCCPERESISCVSFDYERGAYEIACRLFGEGARRILYWRPSADSPQEAYREAGVRSAAQLYPGVELTIALLPTTQVATSDRGERYSAYRRLCGQYLAQDVIPRIRDFEQNDAVICSWGIMANLLGMATNAQKRTVKTASLSSAAAPVTSDGRILLSGIDFFSGGLECTRIVLQQIRGGEPERVLIAPNVPNYCTF